MRVFTFKIHEDGSMECISKEKGAIGTKLYTKSVGSNRARNITSLYKHKEGKVWGKHSHDQNTVNVEICAQYIFLRISRRVVDTRKYDVSEKMNCFSANRINR